MMKDVEWSRRVDENVVRRALDFPGVLEWGSGQSDLHCNARERPADTLLTYTSPFAIFSKKPLLRLFK